MSNKKVKLPKSALKTLVRECLADIMTEDPQFARDILLGAMSSLLESNTQIRRSRRDQRAQADSLVEAGHADDADEPRHVSHVKRGTSRSRNVPVPDTRAVQRPTVSRVTNKKGDIFEQLAADTLERTIPAQAQVEARRSRLYDTETNREGGPATRLAEASRMPMTRQATQTIERVNPRDVESSRFDDMSYDQLKTMAQQSRARGGSLVAEHGMPTYDWDAHEPTSGGPVQIDPSHEQWLAELAAEE